METVEGNKIIAEFMGVKIGIDNYSWRIGVTEKLKEEHLNYHQSWGWLMPVVGKCKEVHFEITGYGFMDSAIPDALTSVDIYKLWLAVIAFIQFYNTTTTNK